MVSYPKYGKPFEPGEFYHVYNQAVGNQNIFLSSENYRFFLDKYRIYAKDNFSTYAFCLLKNHFHFLIKVHDKTQVDQTSERFRRLFISYAKSFNKNYNRKGALFEKHFKRVKIESNEQLLWTIYYIHRNPVHHNVVKSFKKFRWSSYPVILSNKNTRLKRREVFKLFTNREKFIELHERNILEDKLLGKINFKE